MAVSADSGFLRKLPLVFDPMLPPAPQIFNEPPLKNPGDLQEEQLQFTTSILDAEVSDHNKTREKLQRFMGQSLAHERALCTERGVVKYLNTLIQGLKNQIHAETVKRVAAEEEKHALIAQNEMMGDYCGVSGFQVSPIWHRYELNQKSVGVHLRRLPGDTGAGERRTFVGW